MPSKPLNKQHHKIEFKLPEGFLETGTTEQGISKARIAGAVTAGVGVYIMVRVFQKTPGDILRGVFDASFGIVSFIQKALLGFSPGVPSAGEVLGEEALLSANIDPFASSMALVVGGMILAGQNPGEILRGIGEIIPG